MTRVTPRRIAAETKFLVEPLLPIPIYICGRNWGAVMLAVPGEQPECSDDQRMMKALADACGGAPPQAVARQSADDAEDRAAR